MNEYEAVDIQDGHGSAEVVAGSGIEMAVSLWVRAMAAVLISIDLLAFAAADAPACAPVEIFGPKNETRYHSADVSANRDWRQPRDVCAQICLITATCQGLVSQVHEDGSDHCWLKTAALGSVPRDFIAVGGSNSSIWNVTACKTGDKYDACLGNPVMARFSNGTVINAFQSQNASAPFAADIDACTYACLQDAACTGFSIALQDSSAPGPGFQCVLFHDLVDPTNPSRWSSDYVTAVYDISACRAAAGAAAVGAAAGEGDGNVVAIVAGSVAAGVVAIAACLLILVIVVRARSRRTKNAGDSFGDAAWSVHVVSSSNVLDGQVSSRTTFTRDSTTANSEPTLTATTLTARECGDSKDGQKRLLLRQLRSVQRSKAPFLGCYRFLGEGGQHQRVGGQGVVQFACIAWDMDRQYALKFFLDERSFANERSHLVNEALQHVLPPIHTLCGNEDGAIQALGRRMPPFVVTEKGESLNEWARRKNANADLNFSNAMNIVVHLIQRVGELHAAGLVHRDLKPGNVILLPSRNEWTVIDYGSGAMAGALAPMSISIAYAAPETVLAWMDRQATVIADPAVDVWSLAVIAFELLTLTPNYARHRRDTVVQTMRGELPLPWEDASAPNYEADMRQLGFMRPMLLRMLSRDPALRPSLREVQADWNAFLQRGTVDAAAAEASLSARGQSTATGAESQVGQSYG